MANGPPLRLGEEFCCEAVRIESFKKFPRWAPVLALKLAKSGFFFNGHRDEVLCFSCGGRLRSWHYGDEPNVRHRQTFPNCNFMNGRDTFNIPLDQPRNPLYALLEHRLATYETWPRNMTQRPEQLADAGFYYTGLRNWESDDDPWIEHARWFPRCGYVRCKKENTHFGEEARSDITIIGRDSEPTEQENQKLKEERTCKICLDHIVDVVFLPCGHLVSCQECARMLTQCAVCRIAILRAGRVLHFADEQQGSPHRLRRDEQENCRQCEKTDDVIVLWLLPCDHSITVCQQCKWWFHAGKPCPVCRKTIWGNKQIYIS